MPLSARFAARRGPDFGQTTVSAVQLTMCGAIHKDRHGAEQHVPKDRELEAFQRFGDAGKPLAAPRAAAIGMTLSAQGSPLSSPSHSHNPRQLRERRRTRDPRHTTRDLPRKVERSGRFLPFSLIKRCSVGQRRTAQSPIVQRGGSAERPSHRLDAARQDLIDAPPIEIDDLERPAARVDLLADFR